MTKREAIELRDGLKGPFGRWIIKHLSEKGDEIIQSAVMNMPRSAEEVMEREQNLGAGKNLTELVSQIPNTIDGLIKAGTD